MSGASTPEWIIADVVSRLEEFGQDAAVPAR
jgi:4-hydroxy-3-methylbut-2-enyl diphosphate reductase IspH